MKKRGLATVLTLVLCFVLCTVSALAATEYGDFTVDTTVENGCSFSGGVLTISAPGAYTVSMKAGVTNTDDLIVVNAANVELTLKNVQITSKTDKKAALTLNYDTVLQSVGEVSLTGCNGDRHEIASAISGSGKTLTFKSGTLHAYGGNGDTSDVHDSADGAAGIQANVEVQGGTLYATGGIGVSVPRFEGEKGGAGIEGTVTVSGGTVYATGGFGADGATGGRGGAGIKGAVTFSGGTVYATGGVGGKNIGSRDNYGGTGGSGIGGNLLTFSGGIVYATGGEPGDKGRGSDGKGGYGIERTGYSGSICIDYGCVTAIGGTKRSAFSEPPVVTAENRKITIKVGESESTARVVSQYIDQKYIRYDILRIFPIVYAGMDGANYGEYAPTFHSDGTDTVISNPTKANHHFGGWQINNAGELVKNLTLGGNDYTDAITLTAVWTEKEDVICSLQSQTHTYNGQQQAFLPDSEQTGIEVEYYVDGAWTTEAPVDSGSYAVRLTRDEDETYKSFDQNILDGLVIMQASVTVTAKNQRYRLGTELPETIEDGEHYTIEGLIGDDSIGTVTVKYQKDGEDITPDARKSGVYDIVPVVSDVNANYDIIYVNGKLTYYRKTTTYTLTVEETEGGKVSVSDMSAAKGQKVTITPKPNDGMAVDTVFVTDQDGNKIKVTDNGDGTYTYSQPAKRVTVDVTFKSEKCPSEQYSDLDTDAWYHESVDYVLDKGLMQGISDSKFDPSGSTTRAMIVTTLWRLEGEPVVNYAMTFEDVDSDAWYGEAVRWAAGEGLVLGYSAEEFRPDTAITREQMAAIIYRYAGYKNVAPTGAWAIRLEYADIADIADYATEAVMYCLVKNLMQGRDGGIFAPQATASRVEIAVVLHRFIVNSK